MVFYPSAAAAQQAGFRACKRCRPDASPGSPEWNVRADLVARAMRLIADGVIDPDGVPGLAAPARLQRPPARAAAAAPSSAPGPLALARAQRAQTARLLIETTALPHGRRRLRGRLRQHPDLQRHRPRGLRPVPQRAARAAPGRARASRPPRPPGRWRCGCRSGRRCSPTTCSATWPRPRCPAWRSGATAPTGAPCGCRTGRASWRCAPQPDHIGCQLSLTDLRDLATAISRCRRLLDLDADPVAVDDLLRADPVLAPLVDKAPGRRVPRTVDAAEFAVRAVLGQQVSTAAARTHAGRLVARARRAGRGPGGRPDPAVPRRRGAGRGRTRQRWRCPGPGARRSPR